MWTGHYAHQPKFLCVKPSQYWDGWPFHRIPSWYLNQPLRPTYLGRPSLGTWSEYCLCGLDSLTIAPWLLHVICQRWARVAQFSDYNAILYLLPVLWMTSCFHIMGPVSQDQAQRYVSSSSLGGGTSRTLQSVVWSCERSRFTPPDLEKERKGSAFYILCISQSAQAWITQFYLQIHHACLSFVCIHHL